MRIIIVSPGFSNNSGGVNALHLLCHRINSLGVDAFLWHYKRPFNKHPNWSAPWITAGVRLFFYLLKRATIRRKSFLLNPAWKTKELTSWTEKPGDWVIYPDNVYGNILNASNIVRWMLIGTPLDQYDNGVAKTILTYYYSPVYALGLRNPKILRAQNFRHDLFFDDHSKEKAGSCHMFRKNNSGSPPIHPADSICLDGMDLPEVAYWMRRSKYFISYDLYTQHSVHAAVCGCISIVAPKPGLTEADWLPEEDRWGVAYGQLRVEWARATLPLMLERIRKSEAEERAQLKNLLSELNEINDSCSKRN